MLPDLSTFAGSTTSRCQRVVLHHHEQAESAFCTDQLLATKRFAFDPQDPADQLVPLQQACYTAGVGGATDQLLLQWIPEAKAQDYSICFRPNPWNINLSAFRGASFYPWIYGFFGINDRSRAQCTNPLHLNWVPSS